MIYICYGITKSASTFLYQMTEETFRVAGRKPVRLGQPFRKPDSVENYFNFIGEELLAEIAEVVGDRDIVLKTHGTPKGRLAELVGSGQVLANASIRDPREIALSMIDHGKRSRDAGEMPFVEFGTVAETLHALDLQIDCFRIWERMKGIEVFHYNEICFDSAAVVRRIAAQIGADVDPDRVLRIFRSKGRIGQFSKGKALRYTEMAEGDQELMLARYADLYGSYRFETEAARRVAETQKQRSFKASGEFAQRIITFRRRFRL